VKSRQVEIHDELQRIYEKHRKKYKENPDSQQMCCMWSTSNPPDIIEGTAPFLDIEETFGILIDDNDCMDIYDMDIKNASVRITKLIEQKC